MEDCRRDLKSIKIVKQNFENDKYKSKANSVLDGWNKRS